MSNLYSTEHQANRASFDDFLAVDEAAAEAEAKAAAETFHGTVGYEMTEKWGDIGFKVDLGTGSANYSMQLTKPEAKALFNKLFEHRDDFLR